MITCHAAIAPALASAIFYDTFSNAVRETCELYNYPNATKLFDAVCGDVWRECLRRSDMRAWELFKLHANRYCHATGEVFPEDFAPHFIVTCPEELADLCGYVGVNFCSDFFEE